MKRNPGAALADGGPPQGTRPLRVDLRSTPLDVRCALRRLRASLEQMRLSEDDLGRVEILLAEILNNVVEHACAGLPPSRIEVECVEDGEQLNFTVIDEGRAMQDGCFPVAAPGPDRPAGGDLPEGGFGWPMIRQLADAVEYRRGSDRNVLSMSVHRDAVGERDGADDTD